MHMKYDNLISKENLLYSDTNFSNDECNKRFSEIRAKKLKKITDIENNRFIHKEASIMKMNDFNENNNEILKKYGKNKATLNIPNTNYRLDKYLSSINQVENMKFTKNENQIIRRNKIVYDYRKLLKESQLFSSDSIVGKNFQTNNEVENRNIPIEKNKNIDNTVGNDEIINNESNENFSLDKFEETKDASLQDINNLVENNEFKNYDSKKNSREEFLNLKEPENVENEIPNVADNELPKTTEINQILQMTDNTKSNQDITNPSSKKYEDNSQDLKQSNENLTEDNILILNPTSSENKITTDLESVHNIQSISQPQENPPTIIYSEKINKDNSINSDNNEFSEKSLEMSLSEETNNAKCWKKYYYFIEPPNTFEKKLACIIRFKPGSIPKRTSLRCELVNSFEEVPYLDKKEDYASYIFKINPKDSDTIFQFENPWYISIPYYPLLSKAKQPIILIKNDELNKWIECNTNIITSDKIKENDFTFAETRMFKPHGTFTVVSSTIKDVVVITKEGNQIRSMIDKNIMLSVPPNSLRISINASIQVNSIDNLFWKEIKDKHGKGILDQIDFTSAIVEIDAKKKKLINSATLTLNVPDEVIKYPEINPEIKDQKSEMDDSKVEDDKIPLLKRELNPFQKTLMMKQISNTNQVLDVHLLSYINEEDKWTITKENSLSCHDNTNQISIQIPIIQSSKIMLLQCKRNTNEETLTRAAKLIENEFCIRNCKIALFQSTQILNEFALIVSQRKYFQRNLKILQDDGYVLDTKNKLVYVELQERQIITTKFVGNVRNVNLNACETLFTFHSLFPNIQKFRVQEIDPYAQRAVLTFRGYLNLYTTSLVKRPINNVDSKIRKNQIQYTWAEENVMICHLLICISKRKLPLISSFVDYQFRFKNYRNCLSIIKVISGKIGSNWWDLGLHLGVTETRMESIKLHNQDRGLNKMAESMLLFWLKGCETHENKVELLKFALKSCGRSEIIERMYKSQENNIIFGC